ncbi:bifunctional adenosylcobinamide kinase/adenosylcobinamide-phosphate guanylyltransferase, partial [Acinetobacter baumannii]
AHHQNQRPAHWSLVEEPLFLAKTLQKIDRPNQIILVDCLTLWLTNLLLLEDQNIQQFECEQLLKILPTLESEVILVSNETGLGVVPLGEISRRFVDEAGRLHQALGQIANKVVFCVAGFPMILKGEK